MVDEPVESTGFKLEYKQTIIFSVFSEYRRIQTRRNSVFRYFSRSEA